MARPDGAGLVEDGRRGSGLHELAHRVSAEHRLIRDAGATTRTAPARLTAIEHRLRVTTLVHEPAHRLELNASGRVRFRLGAPVIADRSDQVRANGSFIVIGEATNVVRA